MPNPSQETDGWVLLKKPPAETFQTYVVFSAEHGNLTVLKRVPRTASSLQPAMDLFDEVSLQLESRNQGRTWFVQELRVLTRFERIGRSYESLQLASDFAALVCRNHVSQDSRAQLHSLLRTSFSAFATDAPPEVVYFKSLYCFARDEGYPLKQQWMPTLPGALRGYAESLLRSPLAALPAGSGRNPDLALLQDRLEDYLRGHTDILVG